VAVSDVVKVSDEDLEWLKTGESINSHVRRWLDMGPSLVVVTRGKQGATAFLKDARRIDVTAPQVDVVDTVGAGDAFMAGLIDGLWSQGCLGAQARDDLPTISTDIVTYVLTRCVGIAAITVSRVGANPPTAAELGEAPLS
jgi:fructokinase